MYDKSQQGFSSFRGGTPHHQQPGTMKLGLGPKMEKFTAFITAEVCADMKSRGTKVTGHMYNQYCKNGFSNDILAEAVTMTANYAEYLADTRHMGVDVALKHAIPFANDVILFMYVNVSPAAMSNAENFELSRWQVSYEQFSNIRHQVKNHLSGAPTMFPQHNNQAWQNTPAMQQAAYQQALYNQHMQQQAMMQQMPPQQQFMMQNPNMFAGMTSGFQNPSQGTGFGNEANARSNVHALLNRESYAQQQRAMQQYQQHLQQQAMMNRNMAGGFNAPPMGGFGTMPNSYGQPPGFGTGPFRDVVASQQQYPQQNNNWHNQPVRQPMQPAYNATPMPSGEAIQDAFSSYNNNSFGKDTYQTPVATNNYPQFADPTVPAYNATDTMFGEQVPVYGNNDIARKSNSFAEAVKRNTYNHADEANAAKLSSYEYRVRQYAKELGLPWNSTSLDYLESTILEIEPNCPFISKKSPYNHLAGKSVPKQQPVRSLDELLSENDVARIPEAEFNAMAKEMASKSDKVLIDMGNGIHRMVKPEVANQINEFRQAHPNATASQIETFIMHNVAPPYPFVKQRMMDGVYYCEAKHLKDIPMDFRREYKYYVVCDPTKLKGFYTFDKDGYITGFFAVPLTDYPQEDTVDYELHKTDRFFAANTKKDQESIPDMEKTIETFAALQHSVKVEQALETLQNASNSADEETVPITIEHAVELKGYVIGDRIGDDYVTTGLTEVMSQAGTDVVNTEKTAFSYTHLYNNSWYVTGDANKVLQRLRHKTTLSEAHELISTVYENDTMIESQLLVLNTTITNWINKVLPRIGLNVHIDSFLLDWEDIKEYIAEKGKSKVFHRYEKHFVKTILNPSNSSHLVFETLGLTNDYAPEEACLFSIVRDVTVMPIHSREITFRQGDAKQVTVHRDIHPDLFHAINRRFKAADIRAYEYLFVTQDNRVMYAEPTENPDIVILYLDSLLG